MKVLFVSSGNFTFKVIPFIKSQGEALKRAGVELDYFTIKGKGLKGYLRNISSLKKHIKKNNYDVIHAHYILSGWVSVLASYNTIPIILSFMGSDILGNVNASGKKSVSGYINILLSLIIQPFLKRIIIKSANLKKNILFPRKTSIIPNGVDFHIFKSLPVEEYYSKFNLSKDTKKVLFLGKTDKHVKNFKLLQDALDILKNSNIEIIAPYPTNHNDIPAYLNIANILVLTSFHEGSVNVIKEAMACNCPIVSTNVGDVKERIRNTEGCFITSFSADDVADKIKLALAFGKRTNGRENISSLDNQIIVQKIILLYKEMLTD